MKQLVQLWKLREKWWHSEPHPDYGPSNGYLEMGRAVRTNEAAVIKLYQRLKFVKAATSDEQKALSYAKSCL